MKFTIRFLVLIAIAFIMQSYSISLAQGWNIRLTGSLYNAWEDANEIIVVEDYAYITTEETGLRIVDVSDVTQPIEVGFLDTPGIAGGICVVGDFAYIADGITGLQIIDITNPEEPSEVSSLELPDEAVKVVVAGNYAYIVLSCFGIVVVDIENVECPRIIGSYYNRRAELRNLQIQGNFLFATGDVIRVFDVSNPRSPRLITQFREIGDHSGSRNIAISGECAYVTTSNSIYVVDISDPTQLCIMGRRMVGAGVNGLTVSDGFAYSGLSGLGLTIHDISNPARPDQISYLRLTESPRNLCLAANHLFIVCPRNGLKIVDVAEPVNPVQVGEFNPGLVSDLCVHDSKAYLSYDDRGMSILDIEDSFAPRELSSLMFYENLTKRGIALKDSTLFVLVEDNVVGVDVSNPTDPRQNRHRFIAGNSGSDLFIYGSRCYATSRNDGLVIVDISDVSNPIRLGQFNTPGLCVSAIGDSERVVTADGTVGIFIVDVTDPTSPQQLGHYDTPGYATALALVADLLFVADGGSGLRIINISDPENPIEIGSFVFDSWTADVTVVNNFAYLACSESGLRILDVSDPAAPREVGYYNTPGDAVAIAVDGRYAFVADYYFFEIFDCSEAIGLDVSESPKPLKPQMLFYFYPNPFNSSTSISYTLPHPMNIELGVYDLRGHKLQVLTRGTQATGAHTLHWNASALPAGSYLVRMKDEGGSMKDVKKVVLVK